LAITQNPQWVEIEEWMQFGIDKGWISPAYCNTHDGGYEYMSKEEEQEWEDGGDPCQAVFRILVD
jgi:hypothetical protein